MTKLRLGLANLPIARPMTWAIVKGDHSDTFETQVLPHERVASLLGEGALDVGLISATDLDPAEFKPIRDLGVVLQSAAGGATLEFRVPPHQVENMVSGEACPGIAARARELLESQLGKAIPECATNADVRVRSAIRSTAHPDDALDAINRFENSEPVDFAAAYAKHFSQEPCIYLWAYRKGLEIREAEFALKSSLRFGLGSIEALSREVAAELSLEPAAVGQFFDRCVRYVHR